ncbi:MAG: 3-hydroxyacyl-[acyl-carrier-protein] dehydratase [Verrucomicrobiota bacterium]
MSDAFAQALANLPHGPAFRFIDRLVDLEPGKRGAAEYTLRGNEAFLSGHFPGQPLFPGVLLVEAAAQLAGIVAQCDPQIPPMSGLKLTALRTVKIFGTAKPGETVGLEARITGRLGNLIKAETTASVNGVLVMQGELTLSGNSDSMQTTQ